MMLVNKSPRRNYLKLLALLPIVGVTVALNAETVTNMVYKNEEPQKQVPVKKGKKNATIKINANQGIQVVEAIKAPEAADEEKTYETTMNQEDAQNVAVIVYDSKPEDEKPMLIVDDKISTIEQVRALPRDSVVRMAVMRPDAAIKSYGSDAKNGVIIITTQRRQEEMDNELVMPDVFDRADEMPQFPGGHMELMQYLANNIQYPKDAEEAGTQGRVIVSFIVEKDGSISNAKVTKPTYSSLDEEALRVVNAMPKWTPGKVNGKPEKIKYSIPITFMQDNATSPKAEVNELSMRVDGNNPKSVLIGTVKQVKIDNQDALNADIEIDGKKASIEELSLIQHSDIESMQIFEKDDQHPNVRLIITTKKNK